MALTTTSTVSAVMACQQWTQHAIAQQQRSLASSNQFPGSCPAVICGYIEQLFSGAGQIYSDCCSNLLGKTQRSSCFCWTLITFIYSVNYWLQFILAYTGVFYRIVFRIFTSPWERLRSIVMSISVCMSVCPWGYLQHRTRDLYYFCGCCVCPWLGHPPACWR